MNNLAVFALSRRGSALARRLQRQVGGDLFLPEQEVVADPEIAVPPGHLKAELAAAFARYQGLVLIMPVGAAVRLLAPLLNDKQHDPGVVVLDETGQHAVALLSSHLGGGNALARQVAAAVGATPVVTTAAELLQAPALDLLAQSHGWATELDAGLTGASAALLDGEPVGCYQDAGDEGWWRDAPPNLQRYGSMDDLAEAPLAARVVISDRSCPQAGGSGPWVVFRPRTLVAGIGCVRGATADELDDLLQRTLSDHGLGLYSIASLATIENKRDEAGILELAARYGWPLRYFSAAELSAVETTSEVSAAALQAVGAPGVCEPAALLASGGGTLVAPKTKTRRATVAIARIPSPAAIGWLRLVGLGPGAPEDMTLRSRETLEAADAVVGYHGYLDQVRPWLGPKLYHGSPIGEETERCRLAIALARAGQRVALVSSGDAGVYGMAGLVFELLGSEAESFPVEVVPGVSAAQAAAARLGAPLMGDFATISLSDLLTPWPVIAARLAASAAADLVLALYNPSSGRRQHRFAEACALLLQHRAAETPVGLVRNATRPGEHISLTTLEQLAGQPVDMLTLVLVGNSQTRVIGGRLVTSRGYDVP